MEFAWDKERNSEGNAVRRSKVVASNNTNTRVASSIPLLSHEFYLLVYVSPLRRADDFLYIAPFARKIQNY